MHLYTSRYLLSLARAQNFFATFIHASGIIWVLFLDGFNLQSFTRLFYGFLRLAIFWNDTFLYEGGVDAAKSLYRICGTLFEPQNWNISIFIKSSVATFCQTTAEQLFDIM